MNAAAHQTAGHACANPHCDRLAQHGQLACRGCWFALPKVLRDCIWSTWRSQNRRQHSEHVLEARELWTEQHRRHLVTCYTTGQMNEAQWQDHLRTEPGFAEWLSENGVAL